MAAERGEKGPIVWEVKDGVATVWLNRPESRNALNRDVIETLPTVASTALRRDDVQVLVVTGVDPAFCAGLDLRQLGSTGENLGLPENADFPWPWERTGKPVIGAINGAAVAGGFELALQCDLLVASERARFADTHTRVGQIPGAGLTVNLPRAIGPARAKEMSFTGNFITAEVALAWGLVNHVVPHEKLLSFCWSIGADIAQNDNEAVTTLNRLYDETSGLPYHMALEVEAAAALDWQARHHDPSVVAGRREGILSRAHEQLDRLTSEHGSSTLPVARVRRIGESASRRRRDPP
jgi:enoyl-CoA hydratase